MGSDDELLSQFAAPSDGELIARWDMIRTPPDVLVTNYSMLNVMLHAWARAADLRRDAQWLAQDEDAS